MTAFLVDPADMLGEAVTVEHLIPPYPYVTYVHGVRAWPDDDEATFDAPEEDS